MNPKELPQCFIGKSEVRGFQFNQLKRSGSAYLYEVRGSGHAYYEIFECRINSRYGNVMYPSSNAFGVWAVTTTELDKAINWFDKLSSGDRVSNK